MILTRKLAIDLTAGTLLSSIFCALLVNVIMAGGVGDSITFKAFLKAPENILFCLLMSFFIFASWLMRGMNNRTVLFCWALVSVIYYVIYWYYSNYFYNEFRNIYAIFYTSLISSLPIILIIRYRVRISLFVFQKVGNFGFFEKDIENYLCHAKTTDFEFSMQIILYVAFTVELLYSLYMTLYGIMNQIPYNGSIYNHMLEHNNWDPFDLYIMLVNLISIAYLISIGFHLIRDNKSEDAVGYGLSDQEKRAINQKIIDRYRKKSEAKSNSKTSKKRD